MGGGVYAFALLVCFMVNIRSLIYGMRSIIVIRSSKVRKNAYFSTEFLRITEREREGERERES